MSDSTNETPKVDINDLPAETLAFAERMFEAARSGNSELLVPAIEAGLPVNLTNTKGNTLLMLAAYAGHLDLTKALLDKGADPNRENDLGQSIMAGAVFKTHNEVALRRKIKKLLSRSYPVWDLRIVRMNVYLRRPYYSPSSIDPSMYHRRCSPYKLD
ncbi:hypothetical protein Agabi119p4_10088 [Agaricus bisporus var. burnettii]|uniref:Ankyrin repeat protein n=1 Tax=Agaricus bisporus var. burnettii TaxID=192524 RepID=A0A8H7C0V6_AGABI|nr:hypothetical protein Agabi119p4_10088 [Agaricus bisporus var. burnettii]